MGRLSLPRGMRRVVSIAPWRRGVAAVADFDRLARTAVGGSVGASEKPLSRAFLGEGRRGDLVPRQRVQAGAGSGSDKFLKM